MPDDAQRNLPTAAAAVAMNTAAVVKNFIVVSNQSNNE
jgi:hypothetical protein